MGFNSGFKGLRTAHYTKNMSVLPYNNYVFAAGWIIIHPSFRLSWSVAPPEALLTLMAT